MHAAFSRDMRLGTFSDRYIVSEVMAKSYVICVVCILASRSVHAPLKNSNSIRRSCKESKNERMSSGVIETSPGSEMSIVGRDWESRYEVAAGEASCYALLK